jgi:hypothetical protein
MIDRTVQANIVCIKGTKCEIRITRIGDRKILINLIGNDDGELGRIPFDDLNHALDAAGNQAPDLFIDVSQAKGVSPHVIEQWEKWFAGNRSKLATVHLYTQSKFFLITAGMIKELSRLGEIFQIHTDNHSFQKALGVHLESHERHAPPSGSGRVKEQEFSGNLSAFRFVRLRPGVLFIKISGRDTGETIDQVIAELETEIKVFPGPLQLFVDASETRGVSPKVSEEWTRWIAENRNRLLSIDVLSGSRLVTLIVSAAKIFSRTGDLMNVLDHRPEFLQKLESAAPGSEPLLR